MNAYEMADALDWVCENHLTGIGDADFKATATMLRQQQNEIEALKQSKFKDDNKVKELTDEEIANTWDDVRKDATLKSSMKDIQDFARAILRKAQEK